MGIATAFWICMVVGWVMMYLGAYENSAALCIIGLYPIIIWFGLVVLEQGKSDG